MTLAAPVPFVVGLLVAVALAVAAVIAARRRAAALAAAGLAGKTAGLAARKTGVAAGVWLTIAGIGVLALAAADPAVTIPVTRAAGTVILAMDVSGSMSAADVAPSRLGAAKRAARSLIGAQPASVDIGVVAFQQSGLEVAPPSADHADAEAAVGRLTVGGGTSLGDAIVAALSAITHKTVALGRDGAAPDIGYWPSATIVIFSDGGASTGPGGAAGNTADNTAAAAAAAQRAGVHIDTVGVGTAAGATVDVDGYHLFTALDPAALESIARATGGAYHPAEDVSELNGIASSIDLRLTVTHQPLPLAGAFIALALALLVAGAVLTVLRTGRVV